jgi:hypothetical protein
MQLELLPTPTASPDAQRVWEGLTRKQRVKLIAALARLMRQMILVISERKSDER